jgi:mono/diheme cytochrome c family protein
MKRTLITLTTAGAVAALGIASVAYVGLINVGADDPHWKPVHAFLNFVRERSIAVRARDIQVPALDDPALIKAGAGNYNAMCIGCHLAPGVEATELSQSLYPAPPNLAVEGAPADPAISFWIVKHGIKATGMPAWGKSMGDEYLWGLVAFMQKLPQLDAGQYQALVAASSGHQHGGGESMMHDHEGQHGVPSAGGSDHHAAMAEMAGHGSMESASPDGADKQPTDEHAQHAMAPAPAPAPTPAAPAKTHIHADGNSHEHAN